ncbi:hypothetical protein KY290_007980 [Solanum tuberosum]|uniref:Uncharacterized protein n=1 Tax=Solanum tuberosum TaxID=4113 RepID=A0ABQ7W752_SOLTU|nr:hypothetical protein KY290_007980 [Solanum tuberosum]
MTLLQAAGQRCSLIFRPPAASSQLRPATNSSLTQLQQRQQQPQTATPAGEDSHQQLQPVTATPASSGDSSSSSRTETAAGSTGVQQQLLSEQP